MICKCGKTMEDDGNKYILSGNEYQPYKCPECGAVKKELINKWSSRDKTSKQS